jgi:ligand-binding SRPBCC domain-containing protein
MAFYQFQTEQLIPATLDEVWDFISSPKNLKVITPEYMGFDILSKNLPAKMYAGMIISYKVKPLLNIPVIWVTEITHVEEKKFFIDQQLIGPYSLWHHQHIIKEQADGILMTDIVSYSPPFGFLGAIANEFIINKKLKEIFDYRELAIKKKFNF